MRRPTAILASFVFLLLAPGLVAGVVPWWLSRWQIHPAWLGVSALRIFGVLLILMGLPMVLDSFARFAIQGLGTPAPVVPTRHLVVTGLYRHVRNPMYVGVVAVIIGQGLVFAEARLLAYGAIVWLAFHLFVLGYEEPKLKTTFGAEYETVYKNVPRWIPRLRAWTSSAAAPR